MAEMLACRSVWEDTVSFSCLRIEPVLQPKPGIWFELKKHRSSGIEDTYFAISSKWVLLVLVRTS